MKQPKILVAIFHKPGTYDDNFTNLKTVFAEYDMYIPTVDLYGNKWRVTKEFFIENHYDSLFVICSDVSIVCGDILFLIKAYACDSTIGVYGFGTIEWCTFPWLRYHSLHKTLRVPFIEGYCFGVNKELVNLLQYNSIYGYGIDLEMGYQANKNNLKCFVSNDVCIRHEKGKSYNSEAAMAEFLMILNTDNDLKNFAKSINII